MKWGKYKIGEFLDRQLKVFDLDELAFYKRLTIKTKGQGVSLRDEEQGFNIGTKRQFLVEKQEFLLSKIDAMNGAFGIVPEECDNGIITGNFWTYKINVSIANIDYLGLLAEGQIFTQFSFQASSGSTNRKYLDEKKFLNLEIPLPPLPEQKRIVAKLDAVKSKIEKIKQLRAEQEREIKNFLYSKFIDLKKEYENKPLSYALELSLDEIPVNPVEEYLFAGVYGFGKGLFISGIQNGQTSYKVFNKLHSNHIVLSKVKGWEGAIALVTEKFEGLFLSPVYPTFKAKEGININYVAEYCKLPTFWQKLLDKSKGIGARRNSIGEKAFLSVNIPLPPIEIQNKIVLQLDKLNAIKSGHKKTLNELNELLPSLLDKAFKGKLQ